MKRLINYIVVHCTATQPETTIHDIQKYWREQKGWNNPGYHYIINRNGEVVQLITEDRIANGVKGYNAVSVHVSYIGGVDKNNNPIDNRTKAQEEAMIDKLVELSERYPKAEIRGHRDFPNVHKACPSFDVKSWLKNYSPDLMEAA